MFRADVNHTVTVAVREAGYQWVARGLTWLALVVGV